MTTEPRTSVPHRVRRWLASAGILLLSVAWPGRSAPAEPLAEGDGLTRRTIVIDEVDASTGRLRSRTIEGRGAEVEPRAESAVALSAVGTGALGAQTTLVALLNYADRPFEPLSLDDARRIVLDDARSADHYVREVSFGQTWLEPTFVDWTTLPKDRDQYTTNAQTQEDAIAVLDPVVDLTDYARLILIFESRHSPAVVGASTLGRETLVSPMRGSWIASTAWLYLVPEYVDPIGTYQWATAHELGHSFGLRHASAIRCLPASLLDPTAPGAGCDGVFDEYGDGGDLMGTGGMSHVSAASKAQLSWLTPEQTPLVLASGEYLLDQVELPSAGAKALRVGLGSDHLGDDFYYWIEYRTGIGTFPSARDVIQVRSRRPWWVPDHPGSADGFSRNTVRVVAAPSTDVDVGQPFDDPHRGVKVELLEKLGSGASSQARVRVSLSTLELDPRETITFDSSTAAHRVVTVRNVGAASRRIETLSLVGRHPSSYAIGADSCSETELGPGQSCSVQIAFEPDQPDLNLATLVVPSDDELRPLGSASLFGVARLLDCDGDGASTALADGLLVIRYLFGLRGDSLAGGAVSTGACVRCSSALIEAWLGRIEEHLDVDGDGATRALTDGLLVLRELFGLTGESLTGGAVAPGCSRCSAGEISSYIESLR